MELEAWERELKRREKEMDCRESEVERRERQVSEREAEVNRKERLLSMRELALVDKQQRGKGKCIIKQSFFNQYLCIPKVKIHVLTIVEMHPCQLHVRVSYVRGRDSMSKVGGSVFIKWGVIHIHSE